MAMTAPALAAPARKSVSVAGLSQSSKRAAWPPAAWWPSGVAGSPTSPGRPPPWPYANARMAPGPRSSRRACACPPPPSGTESGPRSGAARRPPRSPPPGSGRDRRGLLRQRPDQPRCRRRPARPRREGARRRGPGRRGQLAADGRLVPAAADHPRTCGPRRSAGSRPPNCWPGSPAVPPPASGCCPAG